MPSTHRVLALAILLSCASTLNAQGQTLADAARKAKEQKAQETNKPKKVYTNDNVAAATPDPEPNAATPPADENAKPHSGLNAEQWKAIISRQKAIVDSQQKQLDQLQASIHYVEANAYSNGPAYNAAQKKKEDRVQLMKSKLATEKQRLDELKDQARKAGFGSSVYD